jgi:hypothetical protein
MVNMNKPFIASLISGMVFALAVSHYLVCQLPRLRSESAAHTRALRQPVHSQTIMQTITPHDRAQWWVLADGAVYAVHTRDKQRVKFSWLLPGFFSTLGTSVLLSLSPRVVW